MDFSTILEESAIAEGFAEMPNGNLISIKFLNENFGEFQTVEEMKNATTSEGIKTYFDYLVSEGLLN